MQSTIEQFLFDCLKGFKDLIQSENKQLDTELYKYIYIYRYNNMKAHID